MTAFAQCRENGLAKGGKSPASSMAIWILITALAVLILATVRLCDQALTFSSRQEATQTDPRRKIRIGYLSVNSKLRSTAYQGASISTTIFLGKWW